jgi:hypothetical protein
VVVTVTAMAIAMGAMAIATAAIELVVKGMAAMARRQQ